jgi:prophage regulatory protein
MATLLSFKDVSSRTSLSRSTIYRLLDEETFPKPIYLGTRRAFIESEVTAWIEDRIAESRAA